MPSDNSINELDDLLALIGTDAFSDDAKQRLSDLVSASDEARRIYLEHCQMHAMLHQSTLLSALQSEKRPVSSKLKSTPWHHSFLTWTGLTVAICAVFILGLAVAQFYERNFDQLDAVTPVRIASVQSIDGIAWYGNSELSNGMEVARGKVRVESGSIDLHFDNGTVLLIEGPADLIIESGMQVLLNRGRLAARVSDDAHGFTVLGPDSAVVDLGTEFAMAVENGDSWVQVYDGEVDVALLNEDGRAWKSRELTPSNPVRIDSSSGQIVEEAPPTALPRLARELPHGLAVPTKYIDAVRNDKPTHYWRFEEAGDREVVDHFGNMAAEVRGGAYVDDGGLCFPGGPENHGVAVAANLDPELTNHEFTLELWVNPLFAQKRGVIGITPQNPDSQGHELLYQLRLLPDQRQTVVPGESFTFMADLWPYGEEGVVRVFSENRYRPGQWHHVVAVRRERQLEIYMNGEMAQTAPAPSLKLEPIPSTITIGRSSGPEAERQGRDRHYFKGMVDEVAIYRSALSAEEVAEHYRLMQVKSSMD